MITLVAILCLGQLCTDEIIPTHYMVAGKVDAPISIPFSWRMCKSGGLNQAIDWASHQEQYRGWHVAKILCVPGHYEPSKRA